MEGPKPLRWDRTARVIENVGNRQYSIVLDGSRRVVLRNRRFLRRILPMATLPPHPTTQMKLPVDNTMSPLHTVPAPKKVPPPMQHDASVEGVVSPPATPHTPHMLQPECTQATPVTNRGDITVDPTTPQRRSTRARNPPAYLKDYITGKQLSAGSE